MRKPYRLDEDYNEYVKDFYRKIEEYDWISVTDAYRGLESFLHRYREKRMRDLLNKYRIGDHCLDVGCGTGLILRHLPEGSTGIDINPRHFEKAKQYNPTAHVELGDAENLNFPDESFSTVVCTEVIEHLVHPEKALAHIHRVLRPGGRLIGSTPRKALLWKFRFLSSTHYHNEPFHNEFTTQELRDLFKDFRILLLRTGFMRSTFFFVLEKS